MDTKELEDEGEEEADEAAAQQEEEDSLSKDPSFDPEENKAKTKEAKKNKRQRKKQKNYRQDGQKTKEPAATTVVMDTQFFREQLRQQQQQDSGTFNLLNNLLVNIGGLEFGGHFLGKYLPFRDALSVSRTSKLGRHVMMFSSSYLSSYIQKLLNFCDTRFEQHENVDEDRAADSMIFDNVLDEYNTLLKLPICGNVEMTNYEVFRSCKRQFQAGGSQNNTAIKVDQLMARKKTWNKFLSASGQSVDVYNANMENGEKMETDVNEQEEGNINNVDNNNEQTATTTAAQEINLLGLTDAVQDIEIAIKVWKHHVHVLAPFNIHEWVSGLVLPELELNIVREKLSTKTRLNNSGGWTGCFSNLLVSWCLGKGGCIGQWKRGAWMHQMLKFLVHAVDLGGSVWDNYIQDPRYLGFYKNTFFDSGGQKHSHKLDFWLLVNHMYTSPAKGQCPISRFSTLYKDESFLVLPIVSNSSYDTSATADVSIKSGRPANSQSFQYLYGQHLHLAKTLIRTKAEPLKSSNIPFLSKGEDDLKCWNRQQISDKSDPFFVLGCTELQWQPFEEGLYALVIHSGAIMQPELLATFKVSCEETGELDIYPMPDTWTKWYPHLHF